MPPDNLDIFAGEAFLSCTMKRQGRGKETEKETIKGQSEISQKGNREEKKTFESCK